MLVVFSGVSFAGVVVSKGSGVDSILMLLVANDSEKNPISIFGCCCCSLSSGLFGILGVMEVSCITAMLSVVVSVMFEFYFCFFYVPIVNCGNCYYVLDCGLLLILYCSFLFIKFWVVMFFFFLLYYCFSLVRFLLLCLIVRLILHFIVFYSRFSFILCCAFVWLLILLLFIGFIILIFC